MVNSNPFWNTNGPIVGSNEANWSMQPTSNNANEANWSMQPTSNIAGEALSGAQITQTQPAGPRYVATVPMPPQGPPPSPPESAYVPLQAPPPPPIQYPPVNPYESPRKPGRIKRVLFFVGILVLVGGIIGGGIWLKNNNDNHDPSHRIWSYCDDLKQHQSYLAITNDLINTTDTNANKINAAIIGEHKGWIKRCSFPEINQQGDSVTVSVTLIFTNGDTVTHQYTLKHMSEDSIWSNKNTWRIDAQGWSGY